MLHHRNNESNYHGPRTGALTENAAEIGIQESASRGTAPDMGDFGHPLGSTALNSTNYCTPHNYKSTFRDTHPVSAPRIYLHDANGDAMPAHQLAPSPITPVGPVPDFTRTPPPPLPAGALVQTPEIDLPSHGGGGGGNHPLAFPGEKSTPLSYSNVGYADSSANFTKMNGDAFAAGPLADGNYYQNFSDPPAGLNGPSHSNASTKNYDELMRAQSTNPYREPQTRAFHTPTGYYYGLPDTDGAAGDDESYEGGPTDEVLGGQNIPNHYVALPGKPGIEFTSSDLGVKAAPYHKSTPLSKRYKPPRGPSAVFTYPVYLFLTWWGRRSCVERCFLTLMFASLFTIMILSILIKTRTTKYQILKGEWDRFRIGKKWRSRGVSGGYSNITLDEDEDCTSPTCVTISARLLNSMNLTADPCQDFYEYACGGWINENNIPDGQSSWNNFQSLFQKNQYILKKILERKDTVYDSASEAKAKVYYESCLDENDTVEVLGAEPILKLQANYGGWNFSLLKLKSSEISSAALVNASSATANQTNLNRPQTILDVNKGIEPKAKSGTSYSKLTPRERKVLTSLLPPNWDFQDQMENIARDMDISLLFSVYVSDDDKNSTRNVIYIDLGRLSLPKRDYYLNLTSTENVEILTAYLKYMIGVGLLLGTKQDQQNQQQKAAMLLKTQNINYKDSSAQSLQSNTANRQRTKENLQSIYKSNNNRRIKQSLKRGPLPPSANALLNFIDNPIGQVNSKSKSGSPRTLNNKNNRIGGKNGGKGGVKLKENVQPVHKTSAELLQNLNNRDQSSKLSQSRSALLRNKRPLLLADLEALVLKDSDALIVEGDNKDKDDDRHRDQTPFNPYLPGDVTSTPLLPNSNLSSIIGGDTDGKLPGGSLGTYAQYYKLVTKSMANILALETKIANFTPLPETVRNGEKNYNPMTVRELQQKYDFINWSKYLNSLFELVNYTVDDNHTIIVRSTEYFANLTLLIKDYRKTKEKQTILNNYFMWHVTSRMIHYLSQDFRATLRPLSKALKGSIDSVVAWKTCISDTNVIIGFALGSLFVKEAFKGRNKFMAESMINKIKDAFKAQLPTLDWMDEDTIKVASEKADAIRNKIGFPDYLLHPKELDKKYDGLEFERDEYFANNLRQLRFFLKQGLLRIKKPVDKMRWSLTPPMVNAYYLATGNEMVFPAGILQSPFYDGNFPKALNFGAMGFVVGHELTHGFDDQGRQFDKHGNLKPWWNNASIEKFNERAECLEKQYSTYKLENLNINGKQTIGENIADNGGLKATFSAFRQFLVNNKIEDPLLPGLNMTDNQLFFLAFAQVWCSIDTKKSLYYEILNDSHSPNKIRVIGTLSNSVEFAKAYSCPVGSNMNPAHKCVVW